MNPILWPHSRAIGKATPAPAGTANGGAGMSNRTRFTAAIDKHAALVAADASGEVADSMDVRKKLVEQMHRGEKTLAEIQAELATIKRNAKKNGKLTRTQVWSRA